MQGKNIKGRKAREEMKRNVNVYCHYKRKENVRRKESREDFKKANIEK